MPNCGVTLIVGANSIAVTDFNISYGWNKPVTWSATIPYNPKEISKYMLLDINPWRSNITTIVGLDILWDNNGKSAMTGFRNLSESAATRHQTDTEDMITLAGNDSVSSQLTQIIPDMDTFCNVTPYSIMKDPAQGLTSGGMFNVYGRNLVLNDPFDLLGSPVLYKYVARYNGSIWEHLARLVRDRGGIMSVQCGENSSGTTINVFPMDYLAPLDGNEIKDYGYTSLTETKNDMDFYNVLPIEKNMDGGGVHWLTQNFPAPIPKYIWGFDLGDKYIIRKISVAQNTKANAELVEAVGFTGPGRAGETTYCESGKYTPTKPGAPASYVSCTVKVKNDFPSPFDKSIDTVLGVIVEVMPKYGYNGEQFFYTEAVVYTNGYHANRINYPFEDEYTKPYDPNRKVLEPYNGVCIYSKSDADSIAAKLLYDKIKQCRTLTLEYKDRWKAFNLGDWLYYTEHDGSKYIYRVDNVTLTPNGTTVNLCKYNSGEGNKSIWFTNAPGA